MSQGSRPVITGYESQMPSIGTGFSVLHHFVLPSDHTSISPSEIRTVDLGTYSSFFAAQKVATEALEFCLKQLQSAGISGRVSNLETFSQPCNMCGDLC